MFFRRDGLQDAWTVFLNGSLLFVVLFYVYPLKFMFDFMFVQFLPWAYPSLERMSLPQLGRASAMYASGFIRCWSCSCCRRQQLGLSSVEVLRSRCSRDVTW